MLSIQPIENEVELNFTSDQKLDILTDVNVINIA